MNNCSVNNCERKGVYKIDNDTVLCPYCYEKYPIIINQGA